MKSQFQTQFKNFCRAHFPVAQTDVNFAFRQHTDEKGRHFVDLTYAGGIGSNDHFPAMKAQLRAAGIVAGKNFDAENTLFTLTLPATDDMIAKLTQAADIAHEQIELNSAKADKIERERNAITPKLRRR